MLQRTLMALAVAGGLFLAGCGGGGGGSDAGTGGGGTPTGPSARNEVSGPLDVLQEPVSEQVLAPLATAAAGTPLAGVVNCVDKLVVADTLDIVDSLAATAESGATGFAPSAAALQAELGNLVSDLEGLLSSLATGGTGCGGAIVPAPGGLGSNPLAGTPLEDFGAVLLTTLNTVRGQMGAGGGTPSLSTLTGLFDQISAGYQQALAQLPDEATSAPVLGPALGLVGVALTDLDATVTAAAGANPGATVTAINNTVEHLLTGLLTEVLPLGELEGATGTGGALTGPLTDAIDQVRAALSGGLATPGGDLSALLTAPITDLLEPLLGPVSGNDPTVVLTSLLSQITGALSSGATGGSVTPITGLPGLDEALAVLDTLLAGAGASQSPLSSLVDTLNGLLGGLLGGLGG